MLFEKGSLARLSGVFSPYMWYNEVHPCFLVLSTGANLFLTLQQQITVKDVASPLRAVEGMHDHAFRQPAAVHDLLCYLTYLCLTSCIFSPSAMTFSVRLGSAMSLTSTFSESDTSLQYFEMVWSLSHRC